MGLVASKREIVEIVNGFSKQGSEDLCVSGVENDSRLVAEGALFVALKGDHEHGHKYLNQAFQSGATLALVEDPHLLDQFESSERLIVVDDTLDAYLRLANWWRRKVAVPLIAVTGSVGKTTVKELLASILIYCWPWYFFTEVL